MNKPALNSSIFKDEVNNTGIVLDDTKFPISVFPKMIQEIILDLNDNMGFSVDNTSASMIFAFSTAIGNSYKLEFKRDWIESALVYIAIIGDAGDNKTHPMEWVLEPIKQRDKESQSKYKLDKSHYDSVMLDETILDKPENTCNS